MPGLGQVPATVRGGGRGRGRGERRGGEKIIVQKGERGPIRTAHFAKITTRKLLVALW